MFAAFYHKRSASYFLGVFSSREKALKEAERLGVKDIVVLVECEADEVVDEMLFSE